jgi:hypothetical protein
VLHVLKVWLGRYAHKDVRDLLGPRIYKWNQTASAFTDAELVELLHIPTFFRFETRPSTKMIHRYDIMDIRPVQLAQRITSQQMAIFRRMEHQDCLRKAGLRVVPDEGRNNSYMAVINYANKAWVSFSMELIYSYRSGSGTRSSERQTSTSELEFGSDGLM